MILCINNGGSSREPVSANCQRCTFVITLAYSKMVQISGKYIHVGSSADFEDYLIALGTPAAKAKELANDKAVIEISESGGTWKIAGSNDGRNETSTFKLGETYDERFRENDILQSVSKLEGDKLITTTYDKGVEKGSRTLEFTNDGAILHLSTTSGKTASRTYKRV